MDDDVTPNEIVIAGVDVVAPCCPPVTHTNPLLVAAQTAAKDQVRAWIRAALRETALQAIKMYLSVDIAQHQQETTDETNVTIVEISHATWTSAQDLCLRVATKWGEKLQQVGHHQVAAWIDELVQNEQATLYYQKTTSLSTESPNTTTTHESPSTARTAHESAFRPPTHAEAATDTASAINTNAVMDTTANTVTAWAKLRRLGEHDPCAPENDNTTVPFSHEAAIAVLDRLGEGNATYWPADQWHFIQQAAGEIPARLHGNTATKRSHDEAAQVLQLATSDTAPNEPTTTAAVNEEDSRWMDPPPPPTHSEAVQLLLDRKRKSSNKKRHNRLAKQAKRADVAGATTFPATTETPRSPSVDNGTAALHWERDILADDNWSATERAQLAACLHGNNNNTKNATEVDNDDEQEATSLLLGALRDVGRFHYSNQLVADYVDFDENTADAASKVQEEWTDKQRRRRQREAVQVRLGDHTQIRDEAKKSRLSRVIRTIESNEGDGIDAHAAGCRYWFDLDLGHCVLESGDSATGHRSLFAFGSLELLLLDEDEDSADHTVAT